MKKLELKKVSQTRLNEAKALVAARLYDGAMYLAGYAVETALKAVICGNLKTEWPPLREAIFKQKVNWPTSKMDASIRHIYQIHRLDDLISLAGLSSEFTQRKSDTTTNFASNWSEVSLWNESRRYAAIGTSNATNANNLINALEDPADGILTWLKTKW